MLHPFVVRAAACALLVSSCALEARTQPQATELDALRAELERLRTESAARLAELEAAIARLEAGREPSVAAPVAASAAPGRVRTDDNAFNPALSLVGDFIAAASSEPDVVRDVDFGFSEIELGFTGVIDPWVRFDLFAAFHEENERPPIGLPLPELHHDEQEDDEHEDHEDDEHGHGGLGFELEEAVVSTLGLPAGLKLRAGRFRLPFGRHNVEHLPEDPWADQPTVSLAMFGAEQLIDDGVELSWLTPAPFFWELTAAVTRGPSESPTFARSEDDDFVVLLRNQWFWDLTDSTSLRFGQSWVRGPADEEGEHDSEVAGVDLTLAWVPPTQQGVTWRTEVFWRERPLAVDVEGKESVVEVDDWGAYTWLEGRVSRRWFLGARVDHFSFDERAFAELLEEDGVEERWDASLVATFRPSEFQALRVQVKRTWDDVLDDAWSTLFFNWTWALGAHGAHSY